jgi:transcription termination factor Rho
VVAIPKTTTYSIFKKKSLKFNGLFDELTPILLRINERPEEVT